MPRESRNRHFCVTLSLLREVSQNNSVKWALCTGTESHGAQGLFSLYRERNPRNRHFLPGCGRSKSAKRPFPELVLGPGLTKVSKSDGIPARAREERRRSESGPGCQQGGFQVDYRRVLGPGLPRVVAFTTRARRSPKSCSVLYARASPGFLYLGFGDRLGSPTGGVAKVRVIARRLRGWESHPPASLDQVSGRNPGFPGFPSFPRRSRRTFVTFRHFYHQNDHFCPLLPAFGPEMTTFARFWTTFARFWTRNDHF